MKIFNTEKELFEKKLFDLLNSINLTISLVIPVFNEENRIKNLIEDLPINDKIEIIIINDGSRDKTEKIIRESNKRIVLISTPNNIGFAHASYIGFRIAKGNVILTTNIELGYDPTYIYLLISQIINNNADIVIGSRYLWLKDHDLPTFFKINNKVQKSLVWHLWKQKITDIYSPFKAYKKIVVKSFEYPSHKNMIYQLLSKSSYYNFKIVELYYAGLYPTFEVLMLKAFSKMEKIYFIISNLLKLLFLRFPKISNKYIYINVELLKEKICWSSNQQIDYQIANNILLNFSRRTFSSVKFAQSKPILKKLLSKKIRYNDINNKNLFELIRSLPKIDLHCHLGGCARKRDLKEIAFTYRREESIYNEIEEYFRKKDRKEIDTFLRKNPRNVIEEIFNEKAIHIPKYYAHIIQYLSETRQIDYLDNLYIKQTASNKILKLISQNLPNKNFFGLGLENYLSLGDWGGSTLLQTQKALEAAIKCFCKFAAEHNLRYIELRFNPLSYTKNGLTPYQVYNMILNALLKYRKNIIVNLIFITGKPSDNSELELINYKSEILELLKLYYKIHNKSKNLFNNLEPKVVGFDLAGLEENFNLYSEDTADKIIKYTREEIFKLFEKGFFFTFHCGETLSNPNLTLENKKCWNNSVNSAVYHLNAHRLGHALNISDVSLIEQIKRKNITIELCPSSNCQVSCFNRTPWILSREIKGFNKKDKFKDFRDYPMKYYIKKGLKVCINTDNPAISKTNWTKELFIASELNDGYLTIDQIIELIYNGIEGAFISDSERNRVIQMFDNEIKNVLDTYK